MDKPKSNEISVEVEYDGEVYRVTGAGQIIPAVLDGHPDHRRPDESWCEVHSIERYVSASRTWSAALVYARWLPPRSELERYAEDALWVAMRKAKDNKEACDDGDGDA